MKYIKILGLLACAAVVLMAFAGPVSATITSPPGTAYNGPIFGTSTNSVVVVPLGVSCGHSEFEGHVYHGTTSGPITRWRFSECNKDTVTSLGAGHSAGTLSVASNGTVTSTGAEFTVQMHRSVLGFPITTHCIYLTNNTVIGYLTEGVAPAEIHLEAASIPRKTTDSACGEEGGWSGDYVVTTPSTAIVVD